METCTVRARWLVWRYLPLGPWGCTLVSVREGRLGGGMNSCALKCHLGTLENEGQFTSRVSGFYRHWKKNLTYGIPVPIQVPGKKKSTYSIPVPLKADNLKVVCSLYLRTLLWGRICLGKALACSEPLGGVGKLKCWSPLTGVCLRTCAHRHKENWDLP